MLRKSAWAFVVLVVLTAVGIVSGQRHKERCSNAVDYSAGVHPDTCASHAAARRRGGIEPLCVPTPHELKSCRGTSPTHPGSRNPILPGMPPLLRRNGRFPQAGQERRGSVRRPDHAPERLSPAIRAGGKHAHAPRPRPCGACGLASFAHGVLLNTGPAASSAWGHTGRVRGGPRPPYVPCFASPPQAAGWGPGQMHSPERRNRTPACLHAP